jgi:hypothetical protein
MASEQPQWASCSQDDCIGIQLPTTALCLGHTSEQAPDAFDAELKRIGATGTLDARGVVISADLLGRLLAAAPREADRPTFTVAKFDRATFKDAAEFAGATFEGEAEFARTIFKGAAGFFSSTFEQARQFGPTLIRKQLVLDQAVFKQQVQVEAGAAAVCCRQTQFHAGVQLRLRWASVVLDDANLAAASILTGVPRFADPEEAGFARVWRRLPPRRRGERARPRVLAVQRADLAGLTMSSVDLRVCRFLGAHNLERLRVDTLRDFGFTPQGWKVAETGRAWPPIWRWSPRYTLFEEHCWRAQHERRLVRRHGWQSTVNTGWSDAFDRKVAKGRIEKSSVTPRERQDRAQEIANLYRALRKGREDSKDEPGAADLYYGEMEMRRKATAPLSVERWVLTLYWLVSGYALRASRTMISLGIAVILATLLFANVGFPAQQASRGAASVSVTSRGASQVTGWKQYLDALAYSLESTTSLLRPPDQALTRPGRWVQIVLRLVGPLLFGLIILSLRGRIKR